MAISLLPAFTLNVSAAQERAITLGNSAISSSEYVYYGNYDGSPIKWFVCPNDVGDDIEFADNIVYRDNKDKVILPSNRM